MQTSSFMNIINRRLLHFFSFISGILAAVFISAAVFCCVPAYCDTLLDIDAETLDASDDLSDESSSAFETIESTTDIPVIKKIYRAARITYKLRKSPEYTPGAPLYVMIGDSYMAQYNSLLPKTIAEKLKLSEAKGGYYSCCHSGFGLARQNNRSFLDLIDALPSDPNVTHVLIFGGVYNDWKYGNAERSEVESAMNALAERTRKKFPNAKLMYAIGNWHVNPGCCTDERSKLRASKYQKQLRTRIPWYKEACRKNHIRYLSGVEKTLRKAKNCSYFRADGHHPTREATKKLAAKIAKLIKKQK